MAGSEDRPIVLNGGDQMVTITLPGLTKPNGGKHTLDALPANGEFKKIVFKNFKGKPDAEFPAGGAWTITIE